MLAIAPLKQYDEENEWQYREDIRRRLDKTWKRNANVIIPYGYILGFTGEDGSEAAFKYDAGALQIIIDGVTVVSFATDAALLALETAYQAADATLTASITSEATTRATADSAIAATVTTLTATVSSNYATLDAAVTTEATARADADSAEASTRQSADATLQTNINTVSASVTTETNARVSADGALATRITSLEASVDTPSTGLLARVTVTESAIATNTGAIATISSELVAARDGETTLLAKINAIETAYVAGDTAVAATVTSLTATVSGIATDLNTAEATIVTNTASISTNASAISTLNGSVSSIQTEISAAREGEVSLLAKINVIESAVVSGDAAVASTVTTLTATVAGNTASISTNATAITSLDGRVSAFYGISVNAGTGVASLTLLASGGGSPSGAVILNAATIALDAEAINFGSNTFFEDAENTFYTEASSKRYRWSGPFGASDDVLMWFGPTSVTRGSETRTNGYWAFGTDGVVYYGTAALAPSGGMVATASPSSRNDPAGNAAALANNTGYVTISVTGGTGPYSYYWDEIPIDGFTGTLTIDNPISNYVRWANTYAFTTADLGAGGTWRCSVVDSLGATAVAVVGLAMPNSDYVP